MKVKLHEVCSIGSSNFLKNFVANQVTWTVDVPDSIHYILRMVHHLQVNGHYLHRACGDSPTHHVTSGIWQSPVIL